MTDLLTFNGSKKWDPEIDQWLADQAPELGAMALEWFSRFRESGDDVREMMHDGCPVALVEDAPFGYVNVFKAHMNVGFYRGADLEDPAGLLQGSGKRMRHVKLRPGEEIDRAALLELIRQAHEDIRRRI